MSDWGINNGHRAPYYKLLIKEEMFRLVPTRLGSISCQAGPAPVSGLDTYLSIKGALPCFLTNTPSQWPTYTDLTDTTIPHLHSLPTIVPETQTHRVRPSSQTLLHESPSGGSSHRPRFRSRRWATLQATGLLYML